MRESIKFRGKKTFSEEWVYGFVLQAIPETLETYVVPQEIYNAYEVNDRGSWTLRCENYQQVEADTVGQYTGLKDKNGVEIYEDDVLTGFKKFDLVVVFKDGMFCGKQSNVNYYDALAMWGTETREVIGNIYQEEYKHLRGD